MNRAPPGVDLSFLNEEEARQIFQVLERDTQLKRAEKERISKLHKKKQDAVGLPGVTGEWFEEIQRRKFQKETDVGRMLKPPLAHRLRKAIRNDSTNSKPTIPQIPQAQKTGSPSILGGLRTPFASLFSSFRKSKRPHPKPQQQEQQQYPARYDHFTLGAHSSSKVEEMAKTEACDSLLTSEPTNKHLDATQVEMMEESTSTWNEQLENELLRVLGNLDDQLAREQAQDSLNRRTPIDYGFRTPDTIQYPTVTRQSFLRGMQRKDRSMFLSDGTRTLRAQEEHRIFFRPRKFYGTYMKRPQSEDYPFWDVYDGRSAALKRGHSTRSLGHSSEGSLGHFSGAYNSGFGRKDVLCTDTVSRSYSLSCLARHQSSGSVDQLSTVSPQRPLTMEDNRRFTQRNYYRHPKRTPLSSIVWNTPQSSEHPLYPDGLLRTQSLMEFGPSFEDRHPCFLQDNTKYEFYRSNFSYRKTASKTSPSRGVSYASKLTDPLCFDSNENYGVHPLQGNSSRPRYRYPSFHGRMNLSRKSFPCGRIEEQHLTPDSHQYYSDEVFFSSNANSERTPTNLNDHQATKVKDIGLWQCEGDVQNRVPEYTRSSEHSEDGTAKLFSKHAKGIQNCPIYNSTAALPFVKTSVSNEPGLFAPKDKTEYAVQRQHLFTGAGQITSKPLVPHSQTSKNVTTFVPEDMKGTDQSGRVSSRNVEEGAFELVSQQVDTNSPTEFPIPLSKNFSTAVPQTSLSLKPSPSLGSDRQAKSTAIREIEKMYLSSIHNRHRRQNENCGTKNYLDQAFSPQLTGNKITRAPQNLQEEGHQPQSLGALVHNKEPNKICSLGFSRSPEVLADTQLPDPCTEKSIQQNSLIRHAASNINTSSPRNSPPKSPVRYYTLPRKSASVDGGVISEKPISSPKRTFKNMGDHLGTSVSNRMENFYSNQDKLYHVSSACSSLNPPPSDVAYKENIPQTKDDSLLASQDPTYRSATDTIVGKSEKGTAISCPDKTDTSDCEETDAGNPLQQYKTTSKLTVSIEEDNVKYHELISVYYTLPRKHSRTLCNLFRDDTKNTDSPPSAENSQAPQKKYEVHIGLASVAFPSLKKEEKADCSGKIPATLVTPHSSKLPGDADKGGPLVVSPIMERACASRSQSTMHNREEALGPQMEAPALVCSNKEALDGSVGDPQNRITVEESVSVITNTVSQLHTDTYPSPLKEKSKVDTPLSPSSSNSADPNGSLGNAAVASSAVNIKNAQNESLLCCQPAVEATSSKLHILPSPSVGNNQEGKYAANLAIGTPVNSAEDKTRQDAEVKQRARHICHIISKKGNKLQPRNQSVRSGIDGAFISETKVCSDSQNQPFQVDEASTSNCVLQPHVPDMSALKYQKTDQVETPQPSPMYKDCTHLQGSVRNSVENQNLNPKNQFPSTTQNLPDCSAAENKLIFDCTKDKASDIEKRKNRPSIKNKLAAMYKTSRKFSSKKSLHLKPQISNIFSQNDAPSLAISKLHGVLISPDAPQTLLQTGNENQNHNSLPDELDRLVLGKSENKKSQTTESPPLATHEGRRPFTNLCNQKRETWSVRQSDKTVASNMENPSALFPKETVFTPHHNSQAGDKGLENNSSTIFSRITASDFNVKKKDISNISESLFFPPSANKISNVKNISKTNICPPEMVISPTEYDHDENIKQLKVLRNLNLPCVEPVINPGKTHRERHFSESSYAREPRDGLASESNLIHHNGRNSRKFKSYSELLSCNENDNWEACTDNNKTFGSRRLMYPSVDFGIFGKEQQQAFLDNIKRSLTEGRLWRPCLLKNPGFLKKEERSSLNMSEPLSSGLAEQNTSAEGASPSEPVDVHREDPVDYSDSDSDTTTDDEYYLDENDKESEL